MDRAHRLGQKRQVTVYRLITKGTIDERIVKLARVKKDIQDMVVGQKGVGEKEQSQPNEREIIQMLMEEDQDEPFEAGLGSGGGVDTAELLNGANDDEDGLFEGGAGNTNESNYANSVNNGTVSGTPVTSPSKQSSTPKPPGARQGRGRPPGSTNKDKSGAGGTSGNAAPSTSNTSTLPNTPQQSDDGKPKKRFRRTKKQMEEDSAAAAAHESYLLKEGIMPEKKKRGRKPKHKAEQDAQAQRQFEEMQSQFAEDGQQQNGSGSGN